MNSTSDDPVIFVRSEVFEGKLVTSVFHDWDGDWQYLTDVEFRADRMEMAHQSHVFAQDPSVREIADMPVGVWAHRTHRGAPWAVAVLDEDD
jgi:hypothetical protein